MHENPNKLLGGIRFRRLCSKFSHGYSYMWFCIFLFSRFWIVNIVHSLRVQVNSKATLMFSNLINDEVHENIIWPEVPYVTDEHGSK